MADLANSTIKVISDIAPNFAERLNFVLALVSAASIALLLYLIYLIFRGILRWRDRKRLKRLESQVLRDSDQLDSIEEKIDSLDTKLDLIMHAHSSKKSVRVKSKKKNKKNKKKK